MYRYDLSLMPNFGKLDKDRRDASQGKVEGGPSHIQMVRPVEQRRQQHSSVGSSSSAESDVIIKVKAFDTPTTSIKHGATGGGLFIGGGDLDEVHNATRLRKLDMRPIGRRSVSRN